MRCPECGAPGYRRKTKTPEWRCSRPYPRCGFEWDDAILELLEEEERRLNNQTELEAFRLEADGRKRQLRSEQEVRHRKEKNKQRGGWFATVAFFIGLFIGRQLTDSASGSLLGGILFGFAAYWLGDNWDDSRS